MPGTGTITIGSSDLYNPVTGQFDNPNTHLSAGTRVGPSVAQYMPVLQTNITNLPCISAKAGADGTTSHDYTLIGIEFTPANTSVLLDGGLVSIGGGSSTVASTPYNFTIDRCFVHGPDSTTTAGAMQKIKSGIVLNANNVTIKETYIDEIHHPTFEAKGIAGANGVGNYTITDNFVEACGENFFIGGADEIIPYVHPEQHDDN